MEAAQLAHGGYIRVATEDERDSLDTVLFEVTVFKKETGKYQDTIYFVLENKSRSDISFMRRYEKENAQYYHIYDDFIDFLNHRSFYKDSIITVNSAEYYPRLLFSVKE